MISNLHASVVYLSYAPAFSSGGSDLRGEESAVAASERTQAGSQAVIASAQASNSSYNPFQNSGSESSGSQNNGSQNGGSQNSGSQNNPFENSIYQISTFPGKVAEAGTTQDAVFQAEPAQSEDRVAADPSEDEPSTGSEASAATSADGQALSEEELQMVSELQTRDREVRAHEQAHMAAGSGLTGAANYSYQRGPDGKLYAVGGEVSIDTSVPADPVAALAHATQVIRAALAPAQPSGQDLKVAAKAQAVAAQARAELASSANPQMAGSSFGTSNSASNTTSDTTQAAVEDASASQINSQFNNLLRQLAQAGVLQMGPAPGQLINEQA